MKSSFSPPRRMAKKMAYLIILTDINKEPVVVKFTKDMTLGRKTPDSTPDISVESPIVSRKHGIFTITPAGFCYQDTGSFNGTFINGTLFKSDVNPCNTPVLLNDGDILRFDSRDPNKSHANSVTIIFSTTYDKRSKWRRTDVATNTPVGLSHKGLIEFDVRLLAMQSAAISATATGCTVRKMFNLHNSLQK